MPHSKTVITVFLVFAFCYSGMRPIFPFFNFAINYNYIAEVLCVNKEREVLKCHGKCQLTKEILENAPESTSEYPQLSFEKFSTLFLEKQKGLHFKKYSHKTQLRFYLPLDVYNNNFNKPLLPPPQAELYLHSHT